MVTFYISLDYLSFFTFQVIGNKQMFLLAPGLEIFWDFHHVDETDEMSQCYCLHNYIIT